jgi:hypothetical protein
VTSVRGVGIGAPALQNDSVVVVAVVLVVVCATAIGKIETRQNKNKTAILTIVKV